MGYHTTFEGAFDINPPLAEHHRAYLQKFSHVRHMRRDAVITAAMPDPLRVAVGLPIGEDAIYYVGSDARFGQDPWETPGLIDASDMPCGAPELWCNWEPTDDGRGLRWNGAEKFRNYVEWLQFIIDRFLTPWGYALSGQVAYRGRDADDHGIISIKDGKAIRTQGKTK